MPIREVKPRDNKSVRLAGLEPLVSTHKLHIKRSQTDLESEMFDWPKAKYDDIMDALWGAVQFAIRPVGRRSRLEGGNNPRDEKNPAARSWITA